ncbi:gamma-type small acid-soluble spore protein [Alkalihalobacillus trypoxylicola]|uniref:Small, acid-soluble spore protein gamma-type n=1 Tax=Alkalihalobacillus trypoxylicola TaxID=519424 RepID=A0A161PEY8_9BACI|nr:gamma-type small acid-soluble spore protein [Alkalihalobacillus trypoxylicola]KYG26940.1 spore protein [Alkalihalobacillus trypoxylicola]GAF66564.1 putative small acid-soluble spore protein [Bacillus sp. TS-2]
MDNQQSKTNAQQVKKQNQASEQGSSYNTEFASETDAQEVRQQNAKSAQKKNKNQQ